MKASEFNHLCEGLLIHPVIALENEEIRQALAGRNDEKVKQLLKTEF